MQTQPHTLEQATTKPHAKQPSDAVTSFISQNTFLDSRQVYEGVLNVSKATFYRMVKRGDFPQGVTYTGKGYRWSLGVVKDWIAQQHQPEMQAAEHTRVK